MEASRLRIGDYLVYIHACHVGQSPRSLQMNPGGDLKLGGAFELQI